MPDLSHIPPVAWLAGVLLLAALVARRVPFVRVLVTLAIWGGLGTILVMVARDRGRLDPYVEKVAGALDLDRQQVVGEEMRIRMSPDGHFWARATIGGVERRMLVDSGATITALSTQTAAAAGIKPQDALFPVILQTANGSIRAQTASVDTLRLGNIRASDLAVVVSPAFGGFDVLGMNFLSRLKSWRVEGRTLILTPHHPQGVAEG